MRVALLWPDMPTAVASETTPAASDHEPTGAFTDPAQTLVDLPARVRRQRTAGIAPRRATAKRVTAAIAQTGPFAPGAPPSGPAEPAQLAGVGNGAPVLHVADPPHSRLSGSFWLVARPGGGRNLAFGQLGASQAGERVTYALGEARRFALSARLSSPFRGAGREAAAGVDWQPTRLPVQLLVEERVPLDGGRAEPAAQLIAGVAQRLPARFRLDAYAQGGAVRRRGGFADGAATVTRLLVRHVELGAGMWGAAQRGVARVDVGPTLGVTAPVGMGAVRLGLDYRLRVAGRARPGSGPALTLGSSF